VFYVVTGSGELVARGIVPFRPIDSGNHSEVDRGSVPV
jgi:hypothetical protein